MDNILLSDCKFAASLPCAVVVMNSSAATMRILKKYLFHSMKACRDMTLLNRIYIGKAVSKITPPSPPFCSIWVRTCLIYSEPFGVQVNFAGHVSNSFGTNHS